MSSRSSQEGIKPGEIDREKTPYRQDKDIMRHWSEFVLPKETTPSSYFSSEKETTTSSEYFSPEWAKWQTAKDGTPASRRENTQEYWEQKTKIRETQSQFYQTPLGQTLGEIASEREKAWERVQSTPEKQAWNKMLDSQNRGKSAASTRKEAVGAERAYMNTSEFKRYQHLEKLEKKRTRHGSTCKGGQHWNECTIYEI